MDGLQGLRRNISLKALFVLLAVLAFLFLAAVLSQPARADLIDADSEVIDQVADVVTTGADGDAPLEEVVPPVVEEIIETEVSAPAAEEATEVETTAGEEATEVEEGTPVLDDLTAVVEDVPPIVDESIELEEDVVGVEENVGDVLPLEEIVDDVPIVEVLPAILDDIVSLAPPLVVDVVQVIPILVFDVVAIPGPTDVPTTPTVQPTLSVSPPASLAIEIAEVPTPHSDGLFSRQLVAELAQLQLAGLMALPEGPSSSPLPDQDTPALAAYVPIAAPLPVVQGGASGSGLGSSSHSGSGFYGGFGAFGYFAAMAALLALCVFGWIRDRSRSGRSIFPSHGGRPG